jgi:hypothetical protein
LYALLAAVLLPSGAGVLLLGTGLLPAAIQRLILDLGHDDPGTLHIMQEFGCLMVFAGLITLWLLWRYDQSRFFHWAMTAFWALFALVHWFDVRGAFQPGIGPAINSIPFGLFLTAGLLRLATERGDSQPSNRRATR